MKRIIWFCCIIIAFAGGSAAAQGRKVGLDHEPPRGDELPPPGSPISISVTLINTRDPEVEMRALIVRDGKVMDMKFKDLSADPEDRLVFSMQLTAPLAELNYQFFLTKGEQLLSTSDRYVVRRSCLPNLAPVDATTGRKSPNKLDIFRDKAVRLQVEVQNYENALASLEALKSLTEKKDAAKAN